MSANAKGREGCKGNERKGKERKGKESALTCRPNCSMVASTVLWIDSLVKRLRGLLRRAEKRIASSTVNAPWSVICCSTYATCCCM